MLAHVFGRHGKRMDAAFAFDELDALFVLATFEHNSLDELLDAIDGLESVEMDRSRVPLSVNPQVPPRLDVRIPSQTLLPIDRIQLSELQPLVPLVLVIHHD